MRRPDRNYALDVMLATGERLYEAADGQLGVISNTGHKPLLTDAMLAKEHQLLPATFRLLVKKAERSAQCKLYTDARNVFYTRELLHCPPLLLTDNDGAEYQVTGFSRFDPSASGVSVTCTIVETEVASVEGQQVHLVRSSGYFSCELSTQRMDEQSPGWLTRWKVGTEMSLGNDALFGYIFSNLQPSTGNVDASALTFD